MVLIINLQNNNGNAANFPDIDRYESFMNQWVRMIPNLNRHDLVFEQLNTREDLYRS